MVVNMFWFDSNTLEVSRYPVFWDTLFWRRGYSWYSTEGYWEIPLWTWLDYPATKNNTIQDCHRIVPKKCNPHIKSLIMIWMMFSTRLIWICQKLGVFPEKNRTQPFDLRPSLCHLHLAMRASWWLVWGAKEAANGTRLIKQGHFEQR